LIRPDWKQVHVQTMLDVLLCKVAQHPEIAEWLLATGIAYLVEHNLVKGRDAFWSDDSDGAGQNMLGKLWMQVRSSLGGAGIVAQIFFPSIPLAVTDQQTQKAAHSCLVMNCSRSCSPGELFCSLTHGRAFKFSYLQGRYPGKIDCDYPGCRKPRNPGFDYCDRTHGQIMDEWKRKNNI
jgi:hypothetical protein